MQYVLQGVLPPGETVDTIPIPWKYACIHVQLLAGVATEHWKVAGGMAKVGKNSVMGEGGHMVSDLLYRSVIQVVLLLGS